MAHTNSTTHYEYPQFIGTDKPGWLTDVNNAYSALDTDIYNAQTKADSAYTLADTADGKADNATTTANSALTNAGTANTNIGTMANLETTEKTTLVGAINEVNYNLGLFNLTSFVNYTNLSDYQIVDATGVSIENCDITVAKNGDGSLCKIYGTIRCTSTTTTGYKIKLNTDTGLRPSEAITIKSAGCGYTKQGTYPDLGIGFFTGLDITINTDGTIVFGGSTFLGSGTRHSFNNYIPVLIFVKNFGDTPTPTPTV